MAQILVRKLDEAVAAGLKARARANNRSTEAEVRDILGRAVGITDAPHVPLTSLIGAAPSGRSLDEIVAYVRGLRDEWER